MSFKQEVVLAAILGILLGMFLALSQWHLRAHLREKREAALEKMSMPAANVTEPPVPAQE